MLHLGIFFTFLFLWGLFGDGGLEAIMQDAPHAEPRLFMSLSIKAHNHMLENPPESQSHWSLPHLLIIASRQEGVTKMEPHREEEVGGIWARRQSNPGYPSLGLKHANLRGNHLLFQCCNFPHPAWPPSAHVIFKEPLHPISQKSLRRLVSKALDCLRFKRSTKAGLLFPLKTTHCVGLLCRALWRIRRRKAK